MTYSVNLTVKFRILRPLRLLTTTERERERGGERERERKRERKREREREKEEKKKHYSHDPVHVFFQSHKV